MGTERLLIYDTHPDRAERLATGLNQRFGAERAVYSADPVGVAPMVQGIVQTTPIGQTGLVGTPIPVSALMPEHWLAEIIYFPLETELLRAARELGCRTADGAGMGVYQAVGAFELFTGARADPAAMKASFIEAGRRQGR
jgi:shikimate dehydrogenase